jgi:hypothetical protein
LDISVDIGYSVLGNGYWILDIGYWILDTGYWILDIGDWGSEIGYWGLGMEFSSGSGCVLSGREHSWKSHY